MTQPLDIPGAGSMGLLMAAGRGLRFDSSGRRNKLLEMIDGRPIGVVAAKNMIDAGIDVLAVVRPGSDSLEGLLIDAGCRAVVVASRADEGMGYSLAEGVSQLQLRYQPERILIALADMPYITPATHRAVMDAVTESTTIAAASVDGRRGHPVGFWHTHFDELTGLSGDAGAGRLLKKYPVTMVTTEDSGITRDIDRPDDLDGVS